MTWTPAVGDRVTLLYTEEFTRGGQYPGKKVGEVTHLHTSGCFTVQVRPLMHLNYIDPVNYADYGCSFREWRLKDGWPVQRVTQADLRQQKKLKDKLRGR